MQEFEVAPLNFMIFTFCKSLSLHWGASTIHCVAVYCSSLLSMYYIYTMYWSTDLHLHYYIHLLICYIQIYYWSELPQLHNLLPLNILFTEIYTQYIVLSSFLFILWGFITILKPFVMINIYTFFGLFRDFYDLRTLSNGIRYRIY